jgi:hypothetical protein
MNRTAGLARKDFMHAWWAGFFVLSISVIALSICTFVEVKNPNLMEIWKCAFLTSVGYVVGIPLGAACSRRAKHQPVWLHFNSLECQGINALASYPFDTLYSFFSR